MSNASVSCFNNFHKLNCWYIGVTDTTWKKFYWRAETNFLGTKFSLYDSGIDSSYILKDFLHPRQKVATFEYDSNFFAEKPRSFKIRVSEFDQNMEKPEIRSFENLAPKYNEQRMLHSQLLWESKQGLCEKFLDSGDRWIRR